MTRALSGRGAAGAALLGYLLLTLALTFPLATHFTRAIPGDGFDGWQNYWNLWWVKVALLEQHTSPFFTNLLYHPTGVGLLFHTLNPFNGLLTLPAQVAAGLFPAYNLAVLCGFALGGLGAYLLARQALGPGGSRWAAFVVGVIFTFAPVHIAHLLGHMQVISLEWIPFFALYLLRAAGFGRQEAGVRGWGASRPGYATRAVVGRRRAVLLAALFLILAALCDWYFVLYCLIFSAIVAVWIGLTARPARRALAGLLAIGAIWLLWGGALCPLLLPMVREASQFRFMVPDPTHSRLLSADLLAFVTPHGFHPLWGGWAREQSKVFTSSISEYTVFAGYTVLALAALGALGRSRCGATRNLLPGFASLVDKAQNRLKPRVRGGGPPLGGIASAQMRGLVTPALHQTQCGANVTPQDAFSGPGGPRGARPFAGRSAFWLLVLAVFFTLSLGPVLHIGGRSALLPGGGEIPLPYGWLARTIPFMEITRSVSRYDIMVMLALGVLAGWGVDRLWRGGGRRRWLAAAACAAVLFEFLPAPYPMSEPDTPAWYYTLAADSRSGAVLNLPMNWDRPGYLLYQTVHGKPLTAAYISREDPRTLVERAPALQHFRRLGPDIIVFDLAGQGQQALADLGVRWVALDRYKMPGGAERSVTEAVARQIFGDQMAAYADERLTVYEVAPSPGRAPYLILDAGWGPFDATTRTRAFSGQAAVVIRAPAAGQATLRVTLAVGSAALDAPRSADAFALPLTLQAGDNLVILRSLASGQRVIVKELALAP